MEEFLRFEWESGITFSDTPDGKVKQWPKFGGGVSDIHDHHPVDAAAEASDGGGGVAAAAAREQLQVASTGLLLHQSRR